MALGAIKIAQAELERLEASRRYPTGNGAVVRRFLKSSPFDFRRVATIKPAQEIYEDLDLAA